MSKVPGGLINPVHAGVGRVLLVITVVLVVLAAVNAIFVAWSTVLDSRHPLAVARALGATQEQVSAGISAAQLLSALPGAIARHPGRPRPGRGREPRRSAGVLRRPGR